MHFSSVLCFALQVRRLGLRIALSARLAEGKLVVYQDLEPGSHKTKEMAQHLASAFPSSKKFLLVDHVPKEEPDSTSSTSNTDSTVSAVSAVSTSNEAAGAPGEASSGGVGSGNTEGLVPPPESDSDAVSESHLQSQSQAQSQGESGVHSEGGEAGQAAKEGFTTVRDVYGRLTLRPWSKEERLAHRLARKKAQVHLQRVGEKLVKATGNLHYVSVLPTLVSNCAVLHCTVRYSTLLYCTGGKTSYSTRSFLWCWGSLTGSKSPTGMPWPVPCSSCTGFESTVL